MKRAEINSSHKRLDSTTVLVTRARAQAEEMTDLLEGLGATVIHVPTIEFIPPDDPAPLDHAIRGLEHYDWIIFTSSNAVEFFMQRLREYRSEGVALLGVRSICAIGSATARALGKAGIRATAVAQESTSEGVMRELIERIGGESLVRDLRILIPRAKVAREVLPSRLRDLGAQVDVVEAYQTVLPKITPASLKKLFEESRIDVITFTSSSTVTNLAALMGSTDLSDMLKTALVACIGPVTAEAARKFGLTNIIQPDVYTAAELVHAITTAVGEET
jgi:uroporphyrinogen III methyltransferase/synthase